jgi:hypothetical protein
MGDEPPPTNDWVIVGAIVLWFLVDALRPKW